jgi:hypothetical protein
MVFNQDFTRDSQELRRDVWQGLILKELAVKRAKNIKYLGVQLHENNKNKEHLEKQRKEAIIALPRLNKQGLTSNNIHPNMKGYLYNTYVRPVLFFSVKIFYLNPYEKTL